MDTAALEEWLSRPTDSVRETLGKLKGDLLVLGAAGKMGPTLARMARRALDPLRRVIAVSRFSNPQSKADLDRHGVETISCDLLDRAAVESLPPADNVIFMAGQKFGTSDAPEATWMINAVLPAVVAERFRHSRIVVFSTGCVYALTPSPGPGSLETDALSPPGEYAHSCIARERVFTHFARIHGTPLTIFRLNYAIDLRYGVLHDVAAKVWAGQPVDVTMGHVNVVWQGDANARALQSLARADNPPAIVNVTGSECLSVRWLAGRFGELFGREPLIAGKEADTAWLSNAEKSFEWFGTPSVSINEMIQATADWIRQGGTSLGKPTHFEAHDGRF